MSPRSPPLPAPLLSPGPGPAAAGAPPHRPARRGFRIALGLFWLVAAGIAGELWLRIAHVRSQRIAESYKERNPFHQQHASRVSMAMHRSLWLKRGVAYRPHASVDMVVDGEPYTIAMNGHGFRTREFAVPKPPGRIRIACIGSSTTVEGRSNDETYPALLESMLREQYPDLALEVLDLGISGTTSGFWLERLERLFAFEPDLVVHYDGANDIARAGHAPPRLLGRSLLVERFLFRPAAFDEPIEQIADNFARLHEECRRRGIGYLAATFAAPDPELATGEFRRYLDHVTATWMRPESGLRFYRSYAAIVARLDRRLERLAAERGMPLVDVHRELSDPGLFVDICHRTQPGIFRHALVVMPLVSALVGRHPGACAATSG